MDRNSTYKIAFLVGCPRSGTTLLQSMISSHPKVVSFPETHFFCETLPINPLLRQLKLHGPGSRRFIKDFLDSNGYSALNPFKNINTYQFLTHNQWCQTLITILHKMTGMEADRHRHLKSIWGLEKTPRHLHYISSIEKGGMKNRYLHLLRNGADVVASMVFSNQTISPKMGWETLSQEMYKLVE